LGSLWLFFFAVIVLIGGQLGVGVWLPDVVSNQKHTLAEQVLPNGHSFRVVQYWNHGDFYTTEFQHSFPDGSATTTVLDGDDRKRWSAVLEVNADQNTASVSFP
jgi:hypothetical protein